MPRFARTFARVTLITVALSAPAHARVFNVGPVGAAGCDYNTVQAVINFIAAQAAPDADNTVRLMSGAYTNQRIATNLAVNLAIVGGYASCGATAPSGRSALDGRNTSQIGSLVFHFGDAKLALQHLDIGYGNSTFGGGIDSEGNGTLELSDVQLIANRADWGAGVYAQGPSTTPDPPTKIVRLDGVTFSTNVATGSGGGLLVRNVDLTIAGSGSTWFLRNGAEGLVSGTSDAGGDGAGIFALNSNINVVSHSSLATPFLSGNAARRNGGGLYYAITDPGNFLFTLGNDLATQPLEISANSAGGAGAAVYLSSTATGAHNKLAYAAFYNVNIRYNSGYYGIVAVDSSGSGNTQETPNVMQLLLATSRAGDNLRGLAVAPCAATIACNAIEGNIANDRDVIDATGSSTSLTSVTLSRALVRVNRAQWGGLIFGNNANVSVDSSVIAENTGDSIASVTWRDLHITNDTVANNRVAGLFAALFDNSQVELLHDIFAQPQGAPEVALLGTTVQTQITAQDLLFSGAIVSDKLGGAPNIVAAADSGFIDPAQLDYHLRADSAAIDGWTAPASDPDTPLIDRDGTPRPVLVRPNNPGAYDFGAYEYYVPDAGNPIQPRVAVDPVFQSGYDD